LNSFSGKIWRPLTIFLVCLATYLVTSYGGIRSPDGEMVFLTAQSLAESASFALGKTSSWSAFGHARGKNGRNYSLFGPGESILLAPFAAAGEIINRSGWYKSQDIYIPPSHYLDKGLHDFLLGQRPRIMEPHALRFLASPFNAIISALGSVIFFFILSRLGYSPAVSTPVTYLYAFGTLAWPYSGTFFSEPLATLMVLLSFFLLIPAPNQEKGIPADPVALIFSGLALGAGTATHITAILFFPFFWLLSSGIHYPSRTHKRTLFRASLPFCVGYSIPTALIAIFNYSRFGSVIETGRTVNSVDPSAFDYVQFTLPFEGLYGLTLSSGKGLLFYSPAVIAGLLAWRYFHRRNSYLSVVLLSAISLRVLFIAGQKDWYGGFSLGPRYLVMVIPFLLIPIAEWLKNSLADADKKSIGLFLAITAASISQQIYFSVGEIFSFFHIAKIPWQNTLIDWNKILYFEWDLSPLLHLHEGFRGPYILQFVPISNMMIWAGGTLMAVFASVWYYFKVVQRLQDKPPCLPRDDGTGSSLYST